MPEIANNTSEASASTTPRRRFPAIRVLLFASLLVWGVNRFPAEVGYWLLASAQNAAAEGNLPLAEKRAALAAQWLTNSTLPYEVQADLQWQAEHVEDSLASLDKAAQINPQNEQLKLLKAWRLLEARRTETFEQEVARLAQLPGQEELAYRLELAKLLAIRGETEPALQVINAIPFTKQQAYYVCLVKCDVLQKAARYSEALAVCDVAVEMTGRKHILGEQRISLLLHLQRQEEAIQFLHQLEALQRDTLAERVTDVFWASAQDQNQSAYFRAVANLELERAEKLATLAVNTTKRKSYMILDTSGFVKYRLGKYEEALAELELAITLMEKELPPVDDAETKSTALLPPHVAAAVRWHNHEVRAVLYYHRMLIHEAMNQPTAAAADLQRIQALGRTASEHLF